MLDLALVDAIALLYVLLSIVRGRRRALGDAIHDLVALLLLIALFLGLRLAGELRQLLGGLADSLHAIPGTGSKLLIVVAAWYLMRLLRRRSGDWLSALAPRHLHARITPLVEGLRATLLVAFLAWLAEGWFDGPPQTTPKLVIAVRDADAWLDRQLHPLR